MAVCDKTFSILTDPAGPYAGSVVPVPPRQEMPLEEAKPFDAQRDPIRSPRETEGLDYRPTLRSNDSCCGPSCCAPQGTNSHHRAAGR